MKQYTVNNDDKATYNDSNTSSGCSNNNYDSFTIISEPASRYDSRIRGIPTAAVAAELNADEIDDLVYPDNNNDGDNEDNGDTFHDSIQVEDMIEYTYNDNDDANRKPINNVIDYGEQRLTLYIFNYTVSVKFGFIDIPTAWMWIDLEDRVRIVDEAVHSQ